jgi:hypothetical protein
MMDKDSDLGALPPPSPLLAVVGACLLELESSLPGIIERIRTRLESEAAITATVRIRGPRTEPQVRAAVESALAWISLMSVVAETQRPAKKRRLFWGPI